MNKHMVAEHLIIPAQESIPIRDGYGEGLVEAGRKNPNVIVLAADLTESMRAHWFKETFPERFVEVGVAEQNLVTIAAGMAAVGKIPFVNSYATFSPGRNWEQIRTTACYNDLPVKIAGGHSGLSAGPDGGTHQALEDIALMRVLPNMVVLVPCDYVEARKSVLAALEHRGPVYIRLSRAATPVFTTGLTPFEIGRAEIFNQGKDVTIIAAGVMVYKAMLAAYELAQSGVEAEVINLASVKPFDENTILESVRKTNAVVTAEEHQINGGVGAVISEFLVEHHPVWMKRVGVEDQFGQSGEPEELFTEYGLTVEAIVRAAKIVIEKKAHG